MNSLTTYRAVFKKELRANWRWALVAAIGLTIYLGYEIHQNDGTGYEGGGSFQLWTGIGTAMTFGAPLIALALSILQIAPEQSRDRWAFFVHRPANHTTLFLGKATAGLLLYLAATVLPFIGTALWVKSPGHIAAPFVWGLTLAGFGSVGCGVPFYFAGLLTLLRQVRWYGSRSVPVITAVFGSILAGSMTELWQALLVSLFFSLVIGYSGWDCFASPQGSQRTRAGFIALGVTQFAGLSVILGAVYGLAVAVEQMVFPTHQNNGWTTYQVTTKGDLWKVTYRQGMPDSAVDLSGRPMAVDRSAYANQFLSMYGLSAFRNPSQNPHYNDTSRFVVPIAVNMNQPVNWFRVGGRFLGYSTETRRLAWVLGPNGFLTPEAAGSSGEFKIREGVDTGNSYAYGVNQLVATDETLYLVDFSARRSTTLLSGPEAQAIEHAAIYSPYDSPQIQNSSAALSSTSLYLFDPEGKLVLKVPRDYPESLYNGVSIGGNSERHLIVQYAKNYPSDASGAVVERDPKGIIVRRQLYPAIYMAQTAMASGGIFLVAVAIPAGALAWLLTVETVLLKHQPYSVRHDFFLQMHPFILPGLWGMVLAGAVAMMLTYLIAKRCNFSKPKAAAWMAASFFLTWPGLLVLLALYGWPARKICVQCGKQRPVDRERCPECGAEWPLAPLTGTEIFEETTAAGAGSLDKLPANSS